MIITTTEPTLRWNIRRTQVSNDNGLTVTEVRETKVLQQKIPYTGIDEDGNQYGGFEWVDIPTEE